jgi:hypothetical protein
VAIYEMKENKIFIVPDTTFGDEGVMERQVQSILRDRIETVSSDTLIIAEEFAQWEDSRRRIDLLGLDRNGNLVVIELKRTTDGGHMELQAMRYAAMVSTMTFDQAVEARAQFQNQRGIEGDPTEKLLTFLEWTEPNEDQFAQDVRIVLVSADFSPELTTTVLWLNDRDMDIQCVRVKPHSLDGRLLLDVQQVIPLPGAEEYQVGVRAKTQKVRIAKQGAADYTKYDVTVNDKMLRHEGKGRAILFVFRHLVESGIQPERFSEAINQQTKYTWHRVGGKVDVSHFVDQATHDALAKGKTFDTRRWFLKNGDLIHVEGRTYCFSNQWGGETWLKAMGLLKEKFPEHNISFEPSADSS